MQALPILNFPRRHVTYAAMFQLDQRGYFGTDPTDKGFQNFVTCVVNAGLAFGHEKYRPTFASWGTGKNKRHTDGQMHIVFALFQFPDMWDTKAFPSPRTDRDRALQAFVRNFTQQPLDLPGLPSSIYYPRMCRLASAASLRTMLTALSTRVVQTKTSDPNVEAILCDLVAAQEQELETLRAQLQV